MRKINLEKIRMTFSQIQGELDKKDTDYIVLEVNNTKSITAEAVDKLLTLRDSTRLRIRIIGGYDDERCLNFPTSHHLNDNIYTLSETKRIYKEIAEIEKGLYKGWDGFQKLIYFIGYLKNKIIYHPFHENAPSPDIRSLRGLFSRQTVCAGYALILKELCDRNSIKCEYVEGCCNEEDYQKNRLTHAWNLVEINGKILPVDLTWNATANNRGKTADVLTLFNATEFIQNHFPGRKEHVQNYSSSLSSVDGNKVRLVDAMINKDLRLENNSFTGTRKDSSKFAISLVGQMIRENKVVYKYLYQDVLANGTYSSPVMLYSNFNVSFLVSGIKKIEKTKKQVEDERRHGRYKEADELEKTIKQDDIKSFYDSQKAVGELLFSKENIGRAKRDGSYFLGGIKTNVKPNGKSEYDGVYVDVDFSSKIKSTQKTCRRSDGSSFLIEDYGKLNVAGSLVYRYFIYEQSKNSDGKRIVLKNTIFTDQDLFSDTRQGLYDVFLSRDRLDRKRREANGYLGYYTREGVKTYSERLRVFFTDDLFRSVAINPQDIKNYYKETTFSELKRFIQTYEKVDTSSGVVYRNRVSKSIVQSEDLKLHIRFAYLWLNAAGLEYNPLDPKGLYGFNDAFDKEAEEMFTFFSSWIKDSMNYNGNIDPVHVLMTFRATGKSPEWENTLIRLFSSLEAVQIINKLYRLQNPSAMKEIGNVEYFSSGRVSNANILVERRERLAAQKKYIQVLLNRSGDVQLVEQTGVKRY